MKRLYDFGDRVLPGFLGATFLLIAALFLSQSATPLNAQASAGVVGTVTDPTGGVIPNASIDILDNETRIAEHVTSSGAGTYAEIGLRPGRYTITVEAPGFKTEIRNQVLIEIGTTATVNLTLNPGAASETVEVHADSISLNTTQPQLGSTIEDALIEALPTEVSGRARQIDSFQYLTPGVQGSAFSHQVSGGLNYQQEVVVNGVPMPQVETEGLTTHIDPPWEMVNEFRVERTTFAAQYGMGQGAVNYQTASGTNALHGNAFEINRNSSLDSKGFTNARVPTDHENNYGFTVGGPVKLPKLYDGHDRTFFFFTWEHYKQNATVTGSNDTVPTDQERQGDFSDFVDGTTGQLIPIYDPTTGEQFQYNGVMNVIPQGRLSATSKSLLQYLPEPNTDGVNIGGLDQNRLYDPFANPTLNTVWGFTLDHKLTNSQSLHWAEWRNNLTANQVVITGPLVAPPNPLNAVYSTPELGTGFILGYTNTITPHLVMTAGAGWLGELQNEIPITHPDPSFVVDGSVMPGIQFDGQHAPTNWGINGVLVSINRKLNLTFVNNWVWTKGRQTFNFGGEFRREYQDGNESFSGAGVFQFSHDSTSLPQLPDGSNPAGFSTSGSSFASFMLGIVDSANRSFSESMKLRNFDVSPYVQDDIKLTQRLTVNAGLRWDIMVPFTAVGNNVAFLNPTATNSYAGGLPGSATVLGTCSTCVGWNRADTHWGHIGPRLGFAFMINNKTVVQSGFSLAFMNGGAYAFGDAEVKSNYSQLLGGTYTVSSSGTNQSSYGSWDSHPLPTPSASAIGPQSGVANTIYQLSRNDGYAPYTQQWNVNVQRQLPYDMFLNVAYVGNREIHVTSNLDHPNQYPDSALQLGGKLTDSFYTGTAQADGFALPYPNFVNDFGANATVYQSLKPFPQYSSVSNSFEGAGTAYYNGAQIELDKRYTNGLSFLYALTVARTMSNNDFGLVSGFQVSGMDKYRQGQEYSVSGSDQKYNTKLSFSYDLPIGKGKQFLNKSNILTNIIGGWKINGILDYEGAGPYGVSQSGYSFQPNGFNRPNRVSSVSLSTNSSKRVKDFYLGKTTTKPLMFNPAAFADTGSDYVLGNSTRNYSSLRGSPTRNENLSAKKMFTIADRIKTGFQVDFYNVFNRAILSSGPDTGVRDPSFGYVTGKGQQNSNRQGQATLRFEF